MATLQLEVRNWELQENKWAGDRQAFEQAALSQNRKISNLEMENKRLNELIDSFKTKYLLVLQR